MDHFVRHRDCLYLYLYLKHKVDKHDLIDKLALTKVVFPVEVGDNNLTKASGINPQIVVQVSTLNRGGGGDIAGRKQVLSHGQVYFD